jgi:hypothetical protein
MTQHPWAREDVGKGVLHQILGLVVRQAQRARDSIKNGSMGDQRPRVEDAYSVRVAGPIAGGPG